MPELLLVLLCLQLGLVTLSLFTPFFTSDAGQGLIGLVIVCSIVALFTSLSTAGAVFAAVLGLLFTTGYLEQDTSGSGAQRARAVLAAMFQDRRLRCDPRG